MRESTIISPIYRSGNEDRKVKQCPRPYSWQAVELRIELRQAGSRVHAFNLYWLPKYQSSGVFLPLSYYHCAAQGTLPETHTFKNEKLMQVSLCTHTHTYIMYHIYTYTCAHVDTHTRAHIFSLFKLEKDLHYYSPC